MELGLHPLGVGKSKEKLHFFPRPNSLSFFVLERNLNPWLNLLSIPRPRSINTWQQLEPIFSPRSDNSNGDRNLSPFYFATLVLSQICAQQNPLLAARSFLSGNKSPLSLWNTKDITRSPDNTTKRNQATTRIRLSLSPTTTKPREINWLAWRSGIAGNDIVR